MISAPIREAALASFPPGTPVAVVAPDRGALWDLVRLRGDAAAELYALEEVALNVTRVPAAIPHVLVEGIDTLEDPVAFLIALRTHAPTRLFALISNAGHLTSLAMFFAKTFDAVHPLVPEEIGPLFADAGWKPLMIKTYPDPSLPAPGAAPVHVTLGTIGFQLLDPLTIERASVAGFLVIADPA